jgi:hypothetical protein
MKELSIFNFLQPLFIKEPAISSSWKATRHSFQAVFASDSYEARTDGILQHRYTGNIVEAKRKDRVYETNRVRMQESAEMVTCIMNYQRGRRFDSTGRYVFNNSNLTVVPKIMSTFFGICLI